MSSYTHIFQKIRGRYKKQVSLAPYTWFRTGGLADVVFKPEDWEDLAQFLQNKPPEISLNVLGMGSNLLIRDGGIPGIILRIGFHKMTFHESYILEVESGALNATVSQVCANNGYSGLEFLSGIPGTIGGALRMNAGAYGYEIKDFVISVQAIDPLAQIHNLKSEDLSYSYRSCGLPEDWIFLSARFQLTLDTPKACYDRITEFLNRKSQTQPVRKRTGGSTFKNPPQGKAWELIDQAGCRGLTKGGAQVSPLHCNFLINVGTATSHDLESLGQEVQERVYKTSGVLLEWEIQRIGRP